LRDGGLLMQVNIFTTGQVYIYKYDLSFVLFLFWKDLIYFHFLTLQLDGNSHVIYAETEAAGTRLLINGRTCLLQVKMASPLGF
jgi:hypothetical protein